MFLQMTRQKWGTMDKLDFLAWCSPALLGC